MHIMEFAVKVSVSKHNMLMFFQVYNGLIAQSLPFVAVAVRPFLLVHIDMITR
jgi:hypothetical protein